MGETNYMNYQEACSCCGHKKVAYTLPLNKSMVSALVIFANKYQSEGRRGLRKGDIGLTNSQYANFQNLRHFFFVEQRDKGKEWHLTKYGEKFLRGEAVALVPVGHIGGKTIGATHAAWATHDGGRKRIFVGDILTINYKQRSDYQIEKGFSNFTIFDAMEAVAK